MNLYLRYLLPDDKVWRNASKGTQLERAAAYRFNRGNRKWLLRFSLRWFALAALCNIAGSASLLIFGVPLLHYPLDILSIIGFAMSVLFIGIWLQFEWTE
jgi:hypothetical protein